MHVTQCGQKKHRLIPRSNQSTKRYRARPGWHNGARAAPSDKVHIQMSSSAADGPQPVTELYLHTLAPVTLLTSRSCSCTRLSCLQALLIHCAAVQVPGCNCRSPADALAPSQVSQRHLAAAVSACPPPGKIVAVPALTALAAALPFPLQADSHRSSWAVQLYGPFCGASSRCGCSQERHSRAGIISSSRVAAVAQEAQEDAR
jgi:hypothetical protein